jgi:hypothetical protein
MNLEFILKKHRVETGVDVRVSHSEPHCAAVEPAQQEIRNRIPGSVPGEDEVRRAQELLLELQVQQLVAEFHLVLSTRPA